MRLQNKKRYFSLLELIIIVCSVVLIFTLLIPLYGRAAAESAKATCASNLGNIGVTLAFYADDNNDYLLSAFRLYKNDLTQNWLYYLHMEYKMKAGALLCPAETDAFAFGKCPPNGSPRLMHSYGMHYEAVQDNYHPLHEKFTRRQLLDHGQNPAAHILVADSVANATGSKPMIKSDSSALISSHGGYYSNDAGLKGGSGWYPVGTRHKNQANVLMFDGHVEQLTGEQLFGSNLKYWKPMFYDWKWQK